MPPETFWDGVGNSLSHASGEIVCFAMAVVAIVFCYVKYYMPEKQKQKQFDAEMQQKRLELEMKQQQDAVDVQRENIESRTRQVEILVNLSEQTRSLSQQTAGLATQVAVAIAQLEDSKMNSANIGKMMKSTSSDVTHIREVLDEVKGKVDDVHTIVYKPEISD